MSQPKQGAALLPLWRRDPPAIETCSLPTGHVGSHGMRRWGGAIGWCSATTTPQRTQKPITTCDTCAGTGCPLCRPEDAP